MRTGVSGVAPPRMPFKSQFESLAPRGSAPFISAPTRKQSSSTASVKLARLRLAQKKPQRSNLAPAKSVSNAKTPRRLTSRKVAPRILSQLSTALWKSTFSNKPPAPWYNRNDCSHKKHIRHCRCYRRHWATGGLHASEPWSERHSAGRTKRLSTRRVDGKIGRHGPDQAPRYPGPRVVGHLLFPGGDDRELRRTRFGLGRPCGASGLPEPMQLR